MYLLTNEDNRPFAIVENNTNMRIERAISEEFLYDEVGLIGDTILPDWGETRVFEYAAKDENEGEVTGNVEITKLVKY